MVSAYCWLSSNNQPLHIWEDTATRSRYLRDWDMWTHTDTQFHTMDMRGPNNPSPCLHVFTHASMLTCMHARIYTCFHHSSLGDRWSGH